jgi:hypothetical protein
MILLWNKRQQHQYGLHNNNNMLLQLLHVRRLSKLRHNQLQHPLWLQPLLLLPLLLQVPLH